MGAILVFDNDHNIVELITAILSDEGYVVRTTLDRMPVQADHTRQPPALIVLDLALPAQVVAKVRDYARRHSLFDVPVVLTTTRPPIAAANLARGEEYLLKPFALDDLLVCVARYVQLPRGEPQSLLAVKAQERPATRHPFSFARLCDEARAFVGMSISNKHNKESTMRLYIGNLSQQATEADVQQAFAAFGNVASAKIITDQASGKSRGFGFVEMPDTGQAEAAIAGLTGKDLLGQALIVNEARVRAH